MPKLRMNTDVGFEEVTVQDSEQNLSFPMLLMHPLEFSSEKHPLVMISHGSGGSPLAYRWLAESLARNGYFVGIPEYPFNNRHDNTHEGTIENLIDRPRHLRMAMDAIFADQRWSSHLEENGVALIGHSMGGYTSLALAGGIPHTKHQIQYDPEHKITSSQEVPVKADKRIKALVLMAPATGWFLSEGALSAVKIPILILTGEFDDITPAFHAEIVMKGVPDGKQVTYRDVKNASHYSFLGVFPESVRKTNFPPAMDRPGFDRAKFHDELNVEILDFFAKKYERRSLMKPEWLNALFGGALIGVSVSLMLFLNGRVTGISGILYGLLTPTKKDSAWRWSFLLGLISGGLILAAFIPNSFGGSLSTPVWTLIVAGILVGFGTVLGSGCTSGHGVCGISRLSLRSILATVLFVAAGIASVFFFRSLGVLP